MGAPSSTKTLTGDLDQLIQRCMRPSVIAADLLEPRQRDVAPGSSIRSSQQPSTCHNQVDEAEARLDFAEQAVATSGYPAEVVRVIQGQVAVIRAALFRIRGDLARCVAVSCRALELLLETKTTPSQLRAMAMLNASRAFLVTGNVTAASE